MSSDSETFMQRCVRGESELDQIDEAVDLWHSGIDGRELHDFLGMTAQEYALWLSDPGTLAYIVMARRSGANFRQLVRTDYYEPRLAARPADSVESKRIRAWLKQMGEVA